MHDEGPYDDLVRRLLDLRADAGSPSFGDIATNVSRVRRERGMTAERARVGRTTVYDVFRMGRQRIDADLVADIARALGEDEEAAAEWGREAGRARQAATAVQPGPHPVADTPVPAAGGRLPAARWVVLALVGSLLANLVGRVLVDLLDLPVYLDMVGTAFSAILLGPWWGALVGVLTNVAGTSVSGPESLLFAPVNVLGALIWGYGVRRGLAVSIPRFFVLNLVVALACSSLAVPIIVLLEGGVSGHGTDRIVLSAMTLMSSLWASVTVANLLSSVVDKLICGFVSLAVLETLPPGSRPTGWLRSVEASHAGSA